MKVTKPYFILFLNILTAGIIQVPVIDVPFCMCNLLVRAHMKQLIRHSCPSLRNIVERFKTGKGRLLDA